MPLQYRKAPAKKGIPKSKVAPRRTAIKKGSPMKRR